MLAFNALVRYGDSDWARQAGHKLLESMDMCFRSDGRFDYSKLKSFGNVPLSDDPCHDQPEAAWFDGTANSGRNLEAVICFYEATGFMRPKTKHLPVHRLPWPMPCQSEPARKLCPAAELTI